MTQDRAIGHRRFSRLAAVPLFIALVGSMLSAGIVVAGSGATVARGVQQAYGTCGRDSDGYLMTGSLTGCWWITTFESKTDPDKSNFRATGTEHFDGCLGSVCGTFDTTFSFTAKMDGPWGTSAEIHGRCHHPITPGSGTGGFAGASGVLSFHDVIESPPSYPYVGSIHLARSSGNVSVALAGPRSASAASEPSLSC